MSWDEEEDKTISKDGMSPNLQVVFTKIEKDAKFLSDIRANAIKTLSPYKLTTAEIDKVLEYIGR